jgi:DUF1365 family protein
MEQISFQENTIFSGLVSHTRLVPFRHTFKYKVNYFWFSIDNFRKYKFFKKNKFSLFSFYDRDHGPIEKKIDLWEYFKNQVDTKASNIRYIKAFCLPRILGYNFNPISIFVCYNSKKKPNTIIFEVNNTFRERHLYACKVLREKKTFNLKKFFYVSPFFSVKGYYKVQFKVSNKKINLIIDYYLNKKKVFNASFNGIPRKMSNLSLIKIFLLSLTQNIKVTLSIYIQALKLFLKGARYIKRPKFSKTIFTNINE